MIRLTILSIIFICLITNLSFGQKKCENSIFYELSLNKSTSKKNRRFVVNFNYKMNESLQETLFKSTIFPDEEKLIVKSELSTNNFVPCKKIKEKVSNLKARSLDDKQRYIRLSFSKPIFVSEGKVYLFSEFVIKKEDFSSSKGGASILEIFKKKNNSWVLIDKKILETY